MSSLVSYQLESSIATLTLDDGKVNALSLAMLTQINQALDQALADRAVVVISGRPGIFSAGFDLRVLRAAGPDAVEMLHAGFALAERLLAFPAPVVIACTGHAIAMGVFVVLSADYRVGTAGAYKLAANEVAIGMTMPRTAIEICRQRLAPSHLVRAIALAEPFAPDDALAAGFLDRVVPEGETVAAARAIATQLAALDRGAHTASKARLREPALAAVRKALADDSAAFSTGRL